MTPKEFKVKVEIAVSNCIGKYPDKTGCDFFISDMLELFDQWED